VRLKIKLQLNVLLGSVFWILFIILHNGVRQLCTDTASLLQASAGGSKRTRSVGSFLRYHQLSFLTFLSALTLLDGRQEQWMPKPIIPLVLPWGQPSHCLCKAAYLVPVPSQDKLVGLRQEGHLALKWAGLMEMSH